MTIAQLFATVALEVGHGHVIPLIGQGALLPARTDYGMKIPVTFRSGINFHLVLRGEGTGSEQSIGRFFYDGIDSPGYGDTEIRLLVAVDAGHHLTIGAENLQTGNAKRLGTVDLLSYQKTPKPAAAPDESSQNDLQVLNSFKRSTQLNEPKKGNDLRHELTISFEEAYRGTERIIRVSRGRTCRRCVGSGAKPGTQIAICAVCRGHGTSTVESSGSHGRLIDTSQCSRCGGSGHVIVEKCEECRGRGLRTENKALRVKIPAGVDSETQIRLSGEGEGGRNGGERGDLFVTLTVEPHTFLNRDKANVLLELPLRPKQARQGGTIDIPAITGMKTLTIPAHTKHRAQLVLEKCGMPDLRSAAYGNLLVRVVVTEPDALPDELQKIYELTNASYRSKGVSRWFRPHH